MLTHSEWVALKKALPRFTWLSEIDRVRENCWNCEHYKGFEGTPGTCLLHDMPIPNDERGKDQPCFVQMIIPF